MADGKCPRCGASAKDALCDYCGALASPLADPAEERLALEHFHRALEKADPETRKRLLRNGFVPDHPDALMAAGFKCLPLLVDDSAFDDEPGKSAAMRLSAIITKLKVFGSSSEAEKAVREFEATLQKRETSEKWSIAGGLVVMLGLPLLAILLIYWLFF